MENKNVIITVKNNTKVKWKFDKDHFDHGKWDGDKVKNIDSGKTVILKFTKGTGTSFGVKGYVKYKYHETTLKIEFDKPYGHGSSSFKASCSGSDFEATVSNIVIQPKLNTCDVTIEDK
jgi:hypothetical protein